MPLRTLALVLAVAPAALPGTALAQPMALVIGEGAYAKLPALKAPAADAWSMGEMLKGMGYKVTAYGDLDAAQLKLALDEFAQGADGAEGLVVYFSGHGARLGGKSYLLPVDATGGAGLATEGVSVAALTAKLAKPGRPLMVLIDAGSGPAPEGAGGPGLAKPSLPKDAPVMIAMAAQPGRAPVAAKGDFSAFTLSLLTYLPMPGMPVSTTMRWIARDVKAATGGKQDPLVASALAADYALVPGAPPDTPAEVARPSVAGGTAMFAVMKSGKAPEPTVASAPKPAVTAPAVSPTPAPAPAPAPAVTPAPAPSAPAPAPDAGTDMATLAPSAPAKGDSAPSLGQPSAGDAQVAAMAPGPRPAAPSADSAPRPDAAAAIPAPAAPAPQPAPQTAPQPAPDTQLAALPDPTALAPVTPDALRPQGSVVLPDGTRVPMLEGEPLVRAIQTELKRVNCYSGGIDGDFGSGSRRALKGYLDEEKLPADTLDPTFDVYLQLKQASGKVCPDRAPVRTSAPARTTPRATTPAPAPAPAAPAAKPRGKIVNKPAMGGGLF